MKWMSLDELTTPGVYWVRDESGLRIAEYIRGRFYFIHANGSTPISIAPKQSRYYGPLPQPELEKERPH
jgi:hypothetical protein